MTLVLEDDRVVATTDGIFGSGLHAVVVVSVDDGLLIKQWSAPGWPCDAVTPFVADVVQRLDGVVCTLRGRPGVRAVSVEADDDLIVINEVWPGYVGVFVFPSSTKIGLARMEIRRTMPQVREALWQLAPSPPSGGGPISHS